MFALCTALCFLQSSLQAEEVSSLSPSNLETNSEIALFNNALTANYSDHNDNDLEDEGATFMLTSNYEKKVTRDCDCEDCRLNNGASTPAATSKRPFFRSPFLTPVPNESATKSSDHNDSNLEDNDSTSKPVSNEHVLRGLFLTSDPKKIQARGLDCDGLCLEEIDIPGKKEAFENSVFLPFCNKPLTKETLVEIKRAIVEYYRDHYHPVMTVDVPAQDITSGVVQMLVTEGHLGRVIIKGNKWFSDQTFSKQIRLKPGSVIDSRSLLQDIAWINRNPFHQANLLFTPGTCEGTTDVEVLVQDRLPIRFYVGGDNTGNRGTGEARWFVGFNWGNAFNADQLLNYQYTVGPTLHRFQSHTIDYLAPLPWRNMLEIYGGYSIVHPHVSGFHSKGHSAQGSLRYHIPLGLLFKNQEHKIVWGADVKNMNNNLLFRDEAETPIFNTLVNITQAVLGYDFGYKSKHQTISFNPQIYWSPGKIISHQSEHAYNKMRPHAKNHYVYGTLALGDDITLGQGYVLSFLTRFQGATQTLLPSEQFALGGYDTVRGYEEREVNVDNGFCGNFEARTRPFRVFNKKDALVLLAFVDYGIGSNIHPLKTENKWHHLIGVGPGLRYHFARYVSLRVDVGYRLHKTQYGHGPGFKTHVGLIASY